VHPYEPHYTRDVARDSQADEKELAADERGLKNKVLIRVHRRSSAAKRRFSATSESRATS
jgi:hypothetical protein